jgi:predicted glycosyltransferase
MTVWFDFESTPQVLFLEPIIRFVERSGFRVVLTARPQAQIAEVAVMRGLRPETVGNADRRGLIGRVMQGGARTFALAGRMRREDQPVTVVSSSRTASLAAAITRSKAIGIMDYEHSAHLPIALACSVVWLPDLLRLGRVPAYTKRVARYFPGLKENLYLDGCTIDRAHARSQLGLPANRFLVVARPPAVDAHYASPRSLEMWVRTANALIRHADALVVVSARDSRQREWLERLLGRPKDMIVMRTIVDGPTLIGASNLVLSGGGTMNREAAVLGIPAWSAFCGPTPHIDECLSKEGRLQWIRTDEELKDALKAIPVNPLDRRGPYPGGLSAITDHLLSELHAA